MNEQTLKEHLPLRIILRKNEEDATHYEGLVEHSFSMGWDKHRALVFWSGKAYSMLGTLTLDAVADAESNAQALGGELFDPLDPTCPVQIDFTTWYEATNKFDKRNAFFEHKT